MSAPLARRLHLREEGTISNVSRTFAVKPRPESGLDCLICAVFDRQRAASTRFGSYAFKMVKAVDSTFAVLNSLADVYQFCAYNIVKRHAAALGRSFCDKGKTILQRGGGGY